MTQSQICQFFDNKNVLITGGTGFMGKILIEKLLRSTDVATLFLLVREKKGKNVHARLDDLFDNIVFKQLKRERPKYRHRVVAISGDCSLTGLGLTIGDRKRLVDDVQVVFHVAATVRFDENLKTSYGINVGGTDDLLVLCREMGRLAAVVHVSTAYSNCHLESIDEKVYSMPGYDKVGSLMEKMTKVEVEKITERVISPWPNTYTFTKALAESLIKDKAGNLPIGIFRPAIVISTYKEPIEAWIDNLYGPTGAVAGAATGLLRVFPCDENVIADVVPVDTCVAGLIASAWDIANQKTKKSPNIPIYNYVSSVENPLTWSDYNTLNKLQGVKYPLSKALYTIKFTSVKNHALYIFLRIVLHLIPALLLDCVAMVTGRKPRLLSMYSKIHKFSDVIAFFCTRQWKFRNDNVIGLWDKMNESDRVLFPMSIKTVLWLTYFKNHFKGVRVYLLGDPMETLEGARRRKWWFDAMHESLKVLGIFLGVVLIKNVVLGIFL